MEIMRATLGLEPTGYTIEARLAEIAFGKWEGLTYSEVMARDKHIVAEREFDKWGFTPPGGESYAQVTLRIRNWYKTSAGIRWLPPTAAPRGHSWRISGWHGRRMRRIIPTTRAWSTFSRETGSPAVHEGI